MFARLFQLILFFNIFLFYFYFYFLYYFIHIISFICFHLLIFIFFSLCNSCFHFYSSHSHAIISLVSLYPITTHCGPAWKIHGRFWDASSFSFGDLAPLMRVLRRPNLEGCLPLGTGTWAPSLYFLSDTVIGAQINLLSQIGLYYDCASSTLIFFCVTGTLWD